MTFQVFCRKLKNFTFQKMYRRLREGLWSTHSILLLIRPANAPVDPFPSKPCIGELRFVTEEDLPDCAAFEDPSHYVPVYQEMLRRGDMVQFGYLNGKCVYRCAAMLSGVVEFHGHVVRRLGEKEMLCHYNYCNPAVRGGGWQVESLRNFLRARFDYQAYATVLEDNIPPLVCDFRVGFRPYSRLTVKKRFFCGGLTETCLSEEEVETLMALALPRKDLGNPRQMGGNPTGSLDKGGR